MTDKNPSSRSLAPRADQSIDDRRGGDLHDPLDLAAGVAANNPSVAELVAFRRQAIDLKAAAREARSLDNEHFRMWLAVSFDDDIGRRACAGLQIMSLSFEVLTAIWPADDLDRAEAKLALGEKVGAVMPNRERDAAQQLDPDHARRIRWRRAAFQVPALMLPPGPPLPRADDRGLRTWPLERFNLTAGLALRGDVPAFADREPGRWAAFVGAAPDLEAVLQRAASMFEISDTLVSLAGRAAENASALMTASEGARIAGYLAAAQVMIWPVVSRAGLGAKKKACALINQRALADDPAHQQAAIRHIAAEAAWVKALPADARERLSFDWIEIV